MKGEIDFMPYKDPERKRQWEREHREERNATRRREYLVARSKPAHDLISAQKHQAARRLVLEIIRRRKQGLAAQTARPNIRKQVPDPVAEDKPTNGWKALLGCALAVGMAGLAAWGALSAPGTADLRRC
jgi:hypothetical protein